MAGTITLDTNKPVTAYHVVTGPQVFPYAVDALHAIGAHPLEWKDTPWTQEEAAAARQRLNERNQEDGMPAIPEPAPLSPEDQAALDEHNKAVAEAQARLKAYYDKKAEDERIAAQVAADEVLVASVPPQPDPNARRKLSLAQARKLGSQLSPEEEAARAAEKQRDEDEHKAAMDKLAADKAAAAKAAADKAQSDKLAAANAPITG
jgi:colicin import membrane protein